jgi:hypothetical protein
MKALTAAAVLVATLAGCAARHPPFAVTWYIVYEPGSTGVADSKGEQQKPLTIVSGADGAAGAPAEAASAPHGPNRIVLAVLNQSPKPCLVKEIRVNGDDLKLSTSVTLGRGEILLVRLRDFKKEIKKCVVPVSVGIHGDCKFRVHLLSPEENPVVPLPASFPSSLPETWLDDADCMQANPP